jgi:outer membrane protein TolC
MLLRAIVSVSCAAFLCAVDVDAADLRLSLDEAVDRAVEVSAELKSRSAEIEAGEAEQRSASSERLPDIDLKASYSRVSSVPEFAILQPGVGFTVLYPDIRNQYGLSAALSVPLYTGGSVRSAVEAAEHRVAALNSELGAGTGDLVLETVEAYLGAVVAAEQERVMTAAIAAFQAHLDDVRDRLELGLASAADELSVKVERDRAELARIEAGNLYAVALANLARLLDLPIGTSIELVDRLDAASDQAGELEALAAEALDQRPERAALAARLAEVEAAGRVAQGALKPQIGASAGYDYLRPNSRFFPRRDEFNDSWYLGVELRYRVYDGGVRRAKVASLDAQAAAVRHRLEDLDRAIRLEVEQRWRELESARSAVPVAAQNVLSAKENLKVSRDLYREGLIPSSELLDAEVALMQAGLDRNYALAQQLIAGARLDRAVGRRIS